MLDEKAEISRCRSDIRNKQREATRLCIELGLTGTEVKDPRELEDIKARLERALVALKVA